jgi:group I intron endonuclease
MMVIYKTTNLVDGKYYVGKQQTYTKSYLGSGSALKAAIKKYGRKNFGKEILEVCQSKDELKTKELEWLDKLNAIKDKNSYNLVRETSPNKHRSYSDPEYRKRLSDSIKKMLNTPESKARLSIQNSGINNPMYGKKRTDNFKRLISRCQKGKIVSDETREKIRHNQIGKKASSETKKRMKESQKRRWDTCIVEMTMNNQLWNFDNRYDFISFIKNYNDSIPMGRVRGTGAKRINVKKALKNKYDFIKITIK